MDKQDYMDQVLNLLSGTNTYRTISKDPTIKLRSQIIYNLKDIKQTGGLSDVTYKNVYPTSTVPPSFMGSPKSIKLAPP